MNRRSILKGGALLGAAPLALGSKRLYGTPKSISPADFGEEMKFIIPLNKAGVPTDLLQMSSAVTNLWSSVLATSENRLEFIKNPAFYLEKFGLDSSETVVNDSNLRLLTALAAPSVQESLANKDYSTFFSQMEALGAFEATSPSKLQILLEEKIEKQKEKLIAYIASQTGQSSKLLAEGFVMEGVMATPDDLASLDLLLRDSLAGVTPLKTVSTTVTYVVALAVAIAVVVVVIPVEAIGCGVVGKDGITPDCPVGGGDDDDDDDDDPIVNGSNAAARPAFGNLALSDMGLMKNAERAQRLANLTGNPEIAAHSGRQLIRTEVTAIITALSNTGVLTFADNKLPVVIEAMTRYAWKTVGLGLPQVA